MGNDDLGQYLQSLQRESCYRVEAELKRSAAETTQRVYFEGANGAETGPYIRKFIKRSAGIGGAYERIYHAQLSGRRFKSIPNILECYNRDDELVIVMECIRGQTLQEVVSQHNPSLALAEDIFPRLCDAVTELHNEFDPPIIHRDLKPSNVILAGRGLALIDFGISREYRAGAESDTTHFGTREFAPPEQFGFGQTGVYSDVYALGMVLYFCLTEKIPDAQTRANSFGNALVSEPIRKVIAKAVALDPSMRYESAAALKNAFVAACAETRSTQAMDSNAAHFEQANPTGTYGTHVPPPSKAAANSAVQFASGRNDAASAPYRPKPSPGARNIIVLIATAFFVFICIWGIAVPSESTNYTFEMSVLSLGVFGIPFFMACGYTFADRQRLAERHPAFKGIKLWMAWVAVAIILLGCSMFVAGTGIGGE